MAANKKLTGTIKGRTISALTQEEEEEGGALTVNFDDGSALKIKTNEPTAASDPSAVAGKKVESVQQKDKTLTLSFVDGTAHAVALAEATSSVMLRDKDNKLEYAD